MIHFLFAVLGLLVGGVINLLADDLPRRRSPRLPHCSHCDQAYRPAGFLAVGRWLTSRGICPACGRYEGRRPLLVEIGTMVSFAALPFFIEGWPALLVTAFYFAALILIIVIDMEHRLILHIVTFPTTLLALILSVFMDNGNSFWLAVVGAVAGFLVFYVLYWIGQLTFGPGALGFGDVTLAMTMGAMLGFRYIFFALVIGILLGGLISFLLIALRLLNLRSRIPYGQFLAVAAMVMLLWGPEVVTWYLN